MADRLVINTSPLLVLARADLLEVVGQLPLDFICPTEVLDEIAAGVALGYPDVRPPWLTALELSRPVDLVARATLDLGEAAVIQLAVEQQVARVCLDDRKGRRAAQAVGLQVTGSLGLLVRAKQMGIIATLRPLLERMQREGAYYDEELVRRVLQGVGE